jgi:glycosyltransferase involved in cell wall biosynthesis
MSCSRDSLDGTATLATTEQRVSIIIPTRNRPALLRAAVDSVLGQTRPVDQVIIIDDGTERAEWLPEIQALSPTIEVVCRDRPGGVSAARNAGLERARGDYLLFLDDDDLIEPRLVEQGLAALAAPSPLGGVFFRHRTITSNEPAALGLPRGAEGDTGPTLPFQVAVRENPVPRATLEQRPVTAFLRYRIPICAGFIRRSTVGPARFPEMLRQGEDTYFWISLAAAGHRFVQDERVSAMVRRHADNTTLSRTRYMSEIQSCYEKLLADHLLHAADDVYLAHLKLLCFKTFAGGTDLGPHLRHVLASPRRLAAEGAFWSKNLSFRLLHAWLQ